MGPSASSPEPEPDPADPWASLQSQYKIRGEAADTGMRVAAARNSGKSLQPIGGSLAAKQRSMPMAAPVEVVVTDDDDGTLKYMQSGSNYAAARRPPKAGLYNGAGAKEGGWGKGEFAVAGTLMIGEDELDALAPPECGSHAEPADEEDEDEAAMPVARRGLGLPGQVVRFPIFVLCPASVCCPAAQCSSMSLSCRMIWPSTMWRILWMTSWRPSSRAKS